MKKAWVISILLFCGKPIFAQDIHFSQTEVEPLNLNPALTGVNYNLRATMIYKNQWSPTGVPFKTFGASADYSLSTKNSEKRNIAIGINVLNDQSGEPELKTSLMNIHLASQIKLNRDSKFSAGLFLGFRQLSLTSSDGAWASQFDGVGYDASLASGEKYEQIKLNGFNSGFGMVYHFDNSSESNSKQNQKMFNLGLAVYNLNRPNNSFLGDPDERLSMRFSFLSDGVFNLGRSQYSVLPGIYYHRQGKFSEMLFGSYLRYRFFERGKNYGEGQPFQIAAGLFYRYNDAIIPKVMVSWSDLNFGISYDLNISNLQKSTRLRGGMEFFLTYRIASMKRRFFKGSFN